MATKHPCFKAVQNKIAKKQGVSKKQAGAILAASTEMQVLLLKEIIHV